MISLIDFKEKCNKDFCLRKTFKSKKCLTEEKQELCYDKYKKKLNDVKMKSLEKDYEWEALKEEIWLRDEGCLYLKIATKEEIKILEQIEGWWLSKYVDGAHLVSRSIAKDHIYNRSNVILLNRYIHSNIDNFIDPFTQKYMGVEGMAKWFTRIMQENKLWPSNYDYFDFKRDLGY